MTSAWPAPRSPATLHRLPSTLGISARCRPGHPLLLRAADAGSGQTAKTSGCVPTCSAVHRAKARASPVTHPPLFWQRWWVSARVGNFSPCLSPVTGPGAPDTLWLSAAFIDGYSRAGSGLRVLQSQGTRIPLGLSFQLHCEQQDRNSDSSLSSVVSSGRPPLGARQMSRSLFQLPRLEVFPSVWQPGAMSARIFSLPGIRASADVMGIYWSLTAKGV